MARTRATIKAEMEATAGASASSAAPRHLRAKGLQALEPMLADAAFKPRNYALRYNWPDCVPNRIINAHDKPSSLLYKTITAAKAEEKAKSLYRQTFKFTVQETASETRAEEMKVLVVGMTLKTDFWGEMKTQEAEAAGKKKTEGKVKKERGIVGQHLPHDTSHIFHLPERYTGHKVKTDNIDLLDEVEPREQGEDMLALLVVTPCTEKKPSQTKLYVLMKPDDGLCRLYNCPGNEVVQFPEFRDIGKAQESRTRRWNAFAQKTDEIEGLTAYASIRDKTGVVVGPTTAFANKVVGASSYWYGVRARNAS
jgi:hypothetical protein